MLFIVMSAYDGETLRDRLERGPIAVGDALEIGEQIARALAAAHGLGIVHRDVKPDNVFVTREGVVKLLDFGLARTAENRMSGMGGVGTVAYMSPEQIRGRRADERSDVWALGVILFEMLAAARPFAADDARTAIHLILTRQPDLRSTRPDLAPALARVVHRALAKEPAERFGNGGQVLEALQACRPGAVPSSVSRRAPAPRAVRTGTVVVGLLILATLVSLRGREVPDAGAGVAGGSVSHVLWVDDNPENNTEVIEQLASRGVQVTTALNTVDALQRYDPTLHQLIVSDMGRYEGANDAYVGRAGFDLLARLRARRPDVQLVFCASARAATMHRAEARSSGALDIVDDCAEILRFLGF
jgi:CheY-like chemotaxis protein